MLQRVLDLIGRRPAISPEARDFTHHLLRDHEDDLSQDGAVRLAEIATSAFEFVRDKPANDDTQAGHKIRWRHVGDGTASQIDGARSTLIEILNDDMPFLVDSVVGEVQSRDIPIALVLHPIIKTLRHASGKLIRLTGAGDRNWRQGQESFIQLHLPLMTDAKATDLVAALSRILGLVRLAVNDWQAMLERLDREISDSKRKPPLVAPDEAAEAVAFLEWLLAGNFIFLGMRELHLAGGAEAGELEIIPGGGLGILRDPEVRVLRRGPELVHMSPEVRRFYFQPTPLLVSKANTASVVHRRAPMDYIGVKQYGMGGAISGELRIAGLFTSAAYTSDVRSIPLIRRKIARVADRLGYPADSHSGKALMNVLATFPRDDLFQISEAELALWATDIQDLELRPRVRVFTRVDVFDRFVSALVYVPRDRFSSEVRLRIGETIGAAFAATVSDFTPSFTNGPLVRVQFILARSTAALPKVDPAALEAQVHEITRNWQDRLQARLQDGRTPEAIAAHLARYAGAFPAAYQGSVDPARAMEDMNRVDQLSAARPIGIDFYRDAAIAPGGVRVAIYRLGDPIPLSDRVPLMESFGFRVIDERTFELTPEIAGQRQTVRLHEMALATGEGEAIAKTGADDRVDRKLEACCVAVWDGRCGNDAFNGLVRRAGFDWRQAALFRAYGAYSRQAGVPFTLTSIAAALVANNAVTAGLEALFALRFQPGPESITDRETQSKLVKARIEAALADVVSLEQDRILRHVLNLIEATKRTNFYKPDAAAIAFKFASAEVQALPAPRPFAEIWLHAPSVEGVHLRFAPIARGGIRWSDREQDFRTEVLGLVKAQQVKNTVIVPSGAKGGFVPKRLPPKGTRDDIQREGVAAYKQFIGTLLDLTDNLVDGRVVPPVDVVRHDGDDPYLVVAADKGTAAFSDIANGIALERGFWLGDAFASGGSAGYDHKKMASTARGGWECVKRHFREMDVDIQTTPFRAVGVGDMSGDVFGNAMLLSEETQLVAAFDHRDIFLDPTPDAIVSLAERQRLFALPRSSWQDYDKTRLSPGGGIHPRSAKSVAISEPVRHLLGISEASLTPDELVRAILKAPVDLLWFGGIGTFIKARSETHEQVGDRSTDALRVDAEDLLVKVIGEGANLGLTQRARIAFAQGGGRLNTDFIDNSAGVNSSDLEVNIKITTGAAITAGRLLEADRNGLLASMTPDVAAACLANNYQQGLAISLEQAGGIGELAKQQRLAAALEAKGVLDRRLELLPTDPEFTIRRQAANPLTRPELAVLMSFAKIDLTHAILDSALPDDPLFTATLTSYFPPALRERLPADVASHRLRREIITTAITNETINRLGAATVWQLAEETGSALPMVARAFIITRDVLGLTGIWRQIDALDGRIAGARQLDLYARVQSVVRDQTAWFLTQTLTGETPSNVIARFRDGRDSFVLNWRNVVPERIASATDTSAQGLMAEAVPVALATEIARLPVIARARDVTLVQASTGHDMAQVGPIHAAIAETFRLDELRVAAARIAAQDRYDRQAIDGALSGLARSQAALTEHILRAPDNGAAAGWPGWAEHRHADVERARQRIDRILDAGTLTVARLTVADSTLGDLLQNARG